MKDLVVLFGLIVFEGGKLRISIVLTATVNLAVLLSRRLRLGKTKVLIYVALASCTSMVTSVDLRGVI